MNIVITGASRGIGYSTVKVLAQDKQHKIIILTRNIQGLSDKISADPVLKDADIVAHYLDLQHFTAADLPKMPDHIDVLINNAGLLINKPFSQLTEADCSSMFQTNVMGPAKLIQCLLPQMGQNRPSHIVSIGSMGGFQGSSKFPGLSAYSASKAALSVLSECLAEELKGSHISCNCLCLGAVDTDMLREAFPGYEAPTSSDEMGRFIAEFALNGHKYFNGKTLPAAISTP